MNYSNPKYKLCSKDISAKFGNTSNLLKHLHLHKMNLVDFSWMEQQDAICMVLS